MKLMANSIFITGGGFGISRWLAALHRLGNTAIVAGRRKSSLHATREANSGMHSVKLDIADAANICK